MKENYSIKSALVGNNKQSYSDKLKHPKWQRKRLEIINKVDI